MRSSMKLFVATSMESNSSRITFPKSNQEFMMEKEAKWEQIKIFKGEHGQRTSIAKCLKIFYDYDFSSCCELFPLNDRPKQSFGIRWANKRTRFTLSMRLFAFCSSVKLLFPNVPYQISSFAMTMPSISLASFSFYTKVFFFVMHTCCIHI